MEARHLIIEEKRREPGIGIVSPSDFRVRDAGPVDPRVVLEQPNLSLYCLDFENGQALFVETPPECDLTRAPFMYQAQAEAALRLVQVPFETVHSLASEVAIDPARLILIYSVGRCGSTLVSHAFNQVVGVESLSEPDVPTQMLAHWCAGHLDGPEKVALLKSCTLLQCAPGRRHGATAWALKFRSPVTQMADLFYAAFPDARLAFLYRHAGPWGRSFLRLSGGDDPRAPVQLAGTQRPFGRVIPRLEGRETATRLEMLACMWASQMEKCMEMQRRGRPLFIARYEELTAAPREVLGAMFAHCGLPADAVGDLETVLAEDSQAGTTFSRSSGSEARASSEHVEELCRCVHELFPGLTADTVLPGTYFPERKGEQQSGSEAGFR
jgi:hypothetical protein